MLRNAFSEEDQLYVRLHTQTGGKGCAQPEEEIGGASQQRERSQHLSASPPAVSGTSWELSPDERSLSPKIKLIFTPPEWMGALNVIGAHLLRRRGAGRKLHSIIFVNPPS